MNSWFSFSPYFTGICTLFARTKFVPGGTKIAPLFSCGVSLNSSICATIEESVTVMFKQVPVPLQGSVADAASVKVLVNPVELPSVTPAGSLTALHVYGAVPPLTANVTVTAVFGTAGMLHKERIGAGGPTLFPLAAP